MDACIQALLNKLNNCRIGYDKFHDQTQRRVSQPYSDHHERVPTSDRRDERCNIISLSLVSYCLGIFHYQTPLSDTFFSEVSLYLEEELNLQELYESSSGADGSTSIQCFLNLAWAFARLGHNTSPGFWKLLNFICIHWERSEEAEQPHQSLNYAIAGQLFQVITSFSNDERMLATFYKFRDAEQLTQRVREVCKTQVSTRNSHTLNIPPHHLTRLRKTKSPNGIGCN